MEEGGCEIGKKGAYGLDIFGTPFNFRIHHAFTSYKTMCGFYLTLAMILPIIPFAIYKYGIMKDYGESHILITE